MFRSDPSLLYAAITSLSSAFESLKKADGMSSSLTSFPPDYPFSGEVNAILSDVKSAKTDVSTLSRKISETKDRLCKLDNNFALAYYQSSVSSLNDFVGPLTDKQQMMKEMNQSKYESYLFNYLDDLNSKGLLTADMVDTYQYLKESKNYKQKIDELQKAEKELKSLKENAPSAPAVGGARLSQREAEELMKKSKEYSDYMQKKLALEKNIETLQKETGNYVNKWYEDFGEMFKKTGSAWSKGVNSALNGKGFGDLGVAVKQTAATGAVMAESALSGVNKIAEWVGDGIVAAGGTIASGLTVAGGAIDTARTWLYHDLWTGDNTAKRTMSNALNSASKIMDGTLDIVRQDTVGNLRKNFYENTYLGKSINENSNLKYDSAGAKAISKTTRIGVEALLATAAEVGTFGAATPLVGAMFALEGAGEATESYAQSVVREDGENYNYGKAVLNEALGGLGGYMKGKMYGKIGKNVLSVVDDPTLIAKGASTIKDKGIKNIILDDVRSTAFKVDAGMTAAQKAYEGIVEYNQTGTVDWKKLGLSYVSELITARVTDKLMADNLFVSSSEEKLLDFDVNDPNFLTMTKESYLKTNLARQGISFEKYLDNMGLNVKTLQTAEDIADYFGDTKCYLMDLLKKKANDLSIDASTRDEIIKLYNQYCTTRTGDIDTLDMFNKMYQYMSNGEINKGVIISNSAAARYFDSLDSTEKKAFFNYSACGGFEINGWLNDTMCQATQKSYRDMFKKVEDIQDRVSGYGGINKVFESSERSIVDALDSTISSAKYPDYVRTYRGLQDLYDGHVKIDVDNLKIGDSFLSEGYQSSSVLKTNAYGFNPNNPDKFTTHNILLDILVPPNSGTAAYLEGISGVTSYGQTEMLIKRNAKMTVIGDVRYENINGVLKKIVPVVLE